MESFRIRHGVATDAPALAAFAARTFAETFAADNGPEDMQAHLASSFGLSQQTKELTDPNVVMLLVLLVRPYGIFGTREVVRV